MGALIECTVDAYDLTGRRARGVDDHDLFVAISIGDGDQVAVGMSGGRRQGHDGNNR